MPRKGLGRSEVGETYTRARQICQHLEEPPQLFPVLRGLWNYYLIRAEYHTAHELGEQLLILAQQVQDAAMLVAAHRALGTTLFWLGAIAAAHTHCVQGIALYDPQQHRACCVPLWGRRWCGVSQLCRLDAVDLGYPDQGLARSHEAVTLAQQIAHSF